MTYDKSTLTVEPTSRDRVLTPAFLLVATGCCYARGKDGREYELERTYRSVTAPACDGGPYLTQEGDVFFVDEPVVAGEPVRGWRP